MFKETVFVVFVIFWKCHGIDIIDLDVVKAKKDCNCGRSLAPGRILNGENAGEHEYPWQVFVNVFIGDRKYPERCGGSLISKRHVLTAAHCFGECIR
jgi:hypothetical protein